MFIILLIKSNSSNSHFMISLLLANNAGQSRLLRLAHRMSQMCIRRMNTPTEKTWNLMTSLGYAGIDIFTTSEQYENNLGRPGGTITTVATSISFPFVSADKLYDHLRCGVCRPKVCACISIYVYEDTIPKLILLNLINLMCLITILHIFPKLFLVCCRPRKSPY